MATQSTTTPRGVTEPVRLPTRMTFEQEFLSTLAVRERADRRLHQLVALLNDALGAPGMTLPKSGLQLVAKANGGLIFKGGRS